jgi:hypothetical protein
MSFDLTNKNIQDTFQNLLQKTGSEGKLFDLVGNEITDLTIGGTLTAHSYITSESIVNTSSGSTAFGNSSDDTHKFIGNITASGEISASDNIKGKNFLGKIGSFGVGTSNQPDPTIPSNNDIQLFVTRNGSTAQALIERVGNGELLLTAGASDVEVGTRNNYPLHLIHNNTDRVKIDAGGIDVIGHITASGNISASGHISASKFVGDGSGLTGLTSAAISSYTNNGNNRVVTSVNSSTVNSEANLTFDGTSLNVNGEITSSKVLVDAPNPTDDFFLLKSGSLDSLKVNNQGVLVLGGFTFEPTAIKGGLYYNDNDDEFYAGKNN